MRDMFKVRSARALPRSCAVEPSPARCVPRGRHLPPPPWPACHLAPHRMPSSRLGRAQTPCPTPTSCSFVARGRAPRPSPPLVMARAG
eukprot:scaffold48962_cov58-Phaeocystis_antarctica.AAC.6